MPENEDSEHMKILGEAIQESVNASENFQGNDNGLVTKWMVIAEVTSADGTALIFRAPSHMRPWDIEGMLGFIQRKGSFGKRAT